MNPVDPRIERYLDRLTHPLVQTLDPEVIAEVRMEALFHIESLIRRGQAEGLGGADAIQSALEEYGSAEAAGEGMLDEWCRGRQAMTFARVGPAAFWWSFAIFGLAFGVALLGIEVITMWPGAMLANSDALSGFLAGSAAATAGLIVGRRVPTGNLRALALALLPLVPYAALVGWIGAPLMTPKLLVSLLAVWLVVGGSVLSLTAWFVRHGRPPISSERLSHDQSV